ncbi:hypothetical protein AB1Y20_012128 [Prymnesium parvum]|uniref:Uncharacterized protein n=1 Tax=Prymnesium parvum TaxID=97485 RepID=A0AB34INW0_PRYPA
MGRAHLALLFLLHSSHALPSDTMLPRRAGSPAFSSPFSSLAVQGTSVLALAACIGVASSFDPADAIKSPTLRDSGAEMIFSLTPASTLELGDGRWEWSAPNRADTKLWWDELPDSQLALRRRQAC